MFDFLKPKKEIINLTKEEKLKMLKKFRNATNNYLKIDSTYFKLNKDNITLISVIENYSDQKKELLRIISRWEKELMKENK